MDYYLLLRLGHIVGFTMLGRGLLAVFVSELRAIGRLTSTASPRRPGTPQPFTTRWCCRARCSRPPQGSCWSSSWGSGSSPNPGWSACGACSCSSSIEGNTITRGQFQRTFRRSRAALERGRLSAPDRADARTPLGRVTHLLDLPLFLVIVYCGAMRPDTWAHVLAAIAVALVITVILAIIVPKLAGPPEAVIYFRDPTEGYFDTRGLRRCSPEFGSQPGADLRPIPTERRRSNLPVTETDPAGRDAAHRPFRLSYTS